MQRMSMSERPDWRRQAEVMGFDYHTADGNPYWDETACYRFTLEEIERDIEAPTQQLLEMCYAAVDYTLERPALLRRLGIPEFAWDYLKASWHRRDKDLYGRFDLRYDGEGAAKLFEFNADTPTALFEAAVFQWQWLEQQLARGILDRKADQFNAIHERLVDAFGRFGIGDHVLHLAALEDAAEDRLTVEYLEDCAHQAGLATCLIAVGDIGVTADGRLTDRDDRIITDLFKLYPWEWMLADPFGIHLPKDQTRIIEPVWKMMLSNKGLLAVLWEMCPGHANLLPAYFEDDPRVRDLCGGYVRKPLLGREGSNVEISHGAFGASGNPGRDDGPYGAEGYLVQALAELPDFAGNRPVIGSWIVAGAACGMGIREETSLITSNAARFVPHIILE